MVASLLKPRTSYLFRCEDKDGLFAVEIKQEKFALNTEYELLSWGNFEFGYRQKGLECRLTVLDRTGLADNTEALGVPGNVVESSLRLLFQNYPKIETYWFNFRELADGFHVTVKPVPSAPGDAVNARIAASGKVLEIYPRK